MGRRIHVLSKGEERGGQTLYKREKGLGKRRNVFRRFKVGNLLGYNMAISRMRYLFDGPGTYYIDLAASLSLQERKLHRQFKNYHVLGGLIKDSNNESTIELNTAPDTWVTRTALRRGKRIFDKMVKKNTETAGVVKARWHDYRVLLDAIQGTNHDTVTGANTNLRYPCDAAGNYLFTQAALPELQYSTYHSEDIDWNESVETSESDRDGDSFRPMITGVHLPGSGDGDNWARVSLIQSWFESRNPVDRDEPITDVIDLDDPLLNLFDVSDVLDEVVTEVSTHGDYPPYGQYNHFGMQMDPRADANITGNVFDGYQHNLPNADANLQRQAMAATQGGAGAISALNGFSALCGLVQVQIRQDNGEGLVEMVIDVESEGDEI